MYGQWRKPNVEPTAFGQALAQSELYDPRTSAVVGAYVEESTVGVGTLAADKASADVLRLDKSGTKITEEEYKHNTAQLWYKEYANNLGVLLDKLKLTIENERKND